MYGDIHLLCVVGMYSNRSEKNPCIFIMAILMHYSLRIVGIFTFLVLAGAINDAIYNRGKYENCRFINNTADNFPALSLVTGDAYHSQLSHTPVEIIDWYVRYL